MSESEDDKNLLGGKEETDMFFHAKGELNYANIEWKDIKMTALGRKLDEKMTY